MTPAVALIRRAPARPARGWWTRCLLPLAGWTALILIVATRPAASLVNARVTTALGVSRELLQYPYHLGAFFVLAILFVRCFGARGLPSILLCVLGLVVVSAASELLQFSTPTRTPAARDVLLDLVGAAVGIGAMRLVGQRAAKP